jgi:hypothetical protein
MNSDRRSGGPAPFGEVKTFLKVPEPLPPSVPAPKRTLPSGCQAGSVAADRADDAMSVIYRNSERRERIVSKKIEESKTKVKICAKCLGLWQFQG